MVKKMTSLGVHWWMLALTAVLFGLVAAFVDLNPVVDENFFFSSKDPQFQQTKKIDKQFPSQTEVIFAVSARDISSARYLGRIQRLSQQLREIFAAGFAIFLLSDFPPTQRFGLVVLAGTVIDILANLFVLPLLGGAELKKARAS